MKVTKWERDVDLEEIGELSPYPPCKNERHNLFWKYDYLGPMDALATIEKYGVFEVRDCVRCGRVQRRFRMPENPNDVDILIRLVEEFSPRAWWEARKYLDLDSTSS